MNDAARPQRPLPPALADEDVAVLFGLGFVQSRAGWRFGIDALLLARHLSHGPAQVPGGDRAFRMLEVGTGCGVVSILAVAWGFPGRIDAVECQPALADRARRNVAAAGMDDRILVVQADAAALTDDGTRFDRIASNPPFHRRGHGRPNPDPERCLARHESSLDMAGLFALAADRLAPDGLLSVMYPASRLEAARLAASRAGLIVVGVTPCGHGADGPTRVVILDAAFPGRGSERLHPRVPMARNAFLDTLGARH